MWDTLVCKWACLSLMFTPRTLVNGRIGALHKRCSANPQATRVNAELPPAVAFANSSYPQCKHPVVVSHGNSHPCSPSSSWSKVHDGEKGGMKAISTGLHQSWEDLGLLANLQQKEAMLLSKTRNCEITCYYYLFVCLNTSVFIIKKLLSSTVLSLLAPSCDPFPLVFVSGFFLFCFFFWGEWFACWLYLNCWWK